MCGFWGAEGEWVSGGGGQPTLAGRAFFFFAFSFLFPSPFWHANDQYYWKDPRQSSTPKEVWEGLWGGCSGGGAELSLPGLVLHVSCRLGPVSGCSVAAQWPPTGWFVSLAPPWEICGAAKMEAYRGCASH